MNRALIVASALSLLGGGLGWFTAPAPTSPEVSGPAPVSSIDRLKDEYERASSVLGRVSFAQDTIEDLPVYTPPPPPDIAHLFRRDLTAIETRGDGAIVWIVDFTQPYGRRGLRVGDTYQDGWRVAAIELQAIVLRRRRESRRVEAFPLAPEPNQ
jgi:hypothetical protein